MMHKMKGVELVYDRKAFKREAKQLLRASVPHFMLVSLVYYLLTSGLSTAGTAVSWLTGGETMGLGAVSIFLTILVMLFSIVMGVGFAHYALRLSRREETGMGSLFHAFSFAGRSIGVSLLTALYIFLWSLLVGVAYAVVIGILAVTLEDSVLFAVAAVILYLVLIVLVVIIALRYEMAVFALVDDPDAGVMEAIRRSVQMLRGHKGKLFMLKLSFIGWELLIGLIALVILSVGFYISGLSWVFDALTSAGDDIWEVYSLTGSIATQMSLWSVLAELVCLPLSLWLSVYQQTALARFYNYVGGYDYHQYMNSQPSAQETPLTPPVQEPRQPEEPSAKEEEPPQPPTPSAPDDYYHSILPSEPEETGDEEEI